MSTSPAPSPRWPRYFRWALYGLGGLLGLALVLLLALRFAAQTSFGRNFVEARIEAASPSGQEIEVEGLKGDLLGTFSISRLTVSDEDGVWLEADNLKADWKPLALRNRALRVEALEAELIHILRRPVLVSSAASGSSGGSMPIRAGEIERLNIATFRSEKGVVPRAVSVSIDGQGRINRSGGQSRLSVIPLDGEGDELEADLSWTEDLRVEGQLALDAPAGGLFATLARLEAGQSLSARLDASGTRDDWRAEGNVEIDSTLFARLNGRADDQTTTIELVAHPEAHPLTRRLTGALGDTLTLQANLSREDDTPYLTLTGEAEGLQLLAEARQPRSGVYSADIQFGVDNPSRYAGTDSVFIGEAMLDGTLVYDSGAVRYDGQARAADISLPSFEAASLSGPLSLVYDDRLVSVRTTLSAEEAKLPGAAAEFAGPSPTLKTNAQYDLSSRVLTLRETTLTGEAARIAGAGSLSFASGLTADFSGSFQLDGAAAGLARPVQANGQLQASHAGRTGTRFTTTINATRFGDLPSPLSGWMDERAVVRADGKLDRDGALSLTSLSASSGSLELNGRADLSADRVLSASADIQAGNADLSGLRLGGLNGTVRAEGPFSALDFRADLNTPSLGNTSITARNMNLEADGRYREGRLETTASLTADVQEARLQASTNFALSGSEWTLSDFRAEWENLIATANLSGDGGKLGAMRGQLEAMGDLPQGLPAGRVDMAADIRGEQLALDATLEEVTLATTEADAIVLRANGTFEQADFIIDMDGRTELNGLTYETSLDLDGHIEGLTTGQIDLTASLSALLGDLGLSTQDPIRFTQFEDGWEASAQFAMLGGTLSPAVTTRGQTRLQLQGQSLEIAPLLILATRPALDGALEIDVDIRETENGLSGPISAKLLEIAEPDTSLQPIDLLLDGNLEPDQLGLQLRVRDHNTLNASARMDMQVTTSPAPPFIRIAPEAGIPFSAELNGQIGTISPLILPPQMSLKGLADVSLSGALPSLNESFEGTFSLREGEFEHGALGLVLNQIRTAADLGNGRLSLREFEARGRSGGELSGRGSMAINGSGASDLTLSANKLVVTERREGSATVSGDMRLNQQPGLLQVTGDLTVDEALINIDKLPSGGPPTLDVSFEAPKDDTLPEEDDAATRLDITLSAPDQIRLRGSGVNAELSLDAQVKGTMGEPDITGVARIVRGRFDLIGKRFDLSDESSVRIERDLGSSRLDIQARHETNDDVTAILNVVGTIDRPEIEITSEPELPEDEVLSRVLFGRSPSQLTALETARLAAALAQLSGGGGFDLVGGLGDALGLDTLDLGQSTGGDVELTSGKYIAEDVYLEVRSGASGAPGVAIEWEPLSNIEVEAATSTDEGQQLSIQWKRDFD